MPERNVSIPPLQEDLSEADLSRLYSANLVAVDCEMAGLNPRRDPLYLVQLCDAHHNINILRTADWHQARRLKEVLLSPVIQKVFHFAIMDCAFLTANLGAPVQNAYCTKIASKIARTYAATHSLSTLAEELLGNPIDKKQRTTFWGSDELTAAQIEYAIQDVVNLLEIKERLEAIMSRKGQLPDGITYLELNQACQHFIPTLVHLWTNGWDFGKEDPASIFGR